MLAKGAEQEQGAGASNSPPLARPSDEQAHPFRSEMAIVERKNNSGKFAKEEAKIRNNAYAYNVPIKGPL